MIKVTAQNSHTATKVILYRIWVIECWQRTDVEVRDVCSLSQSWIKLQLRNYTACLMPHDCTLHIERIFCSFDYDKIYLINYK